MKVPSLSQLPVINILINPMCSSEVVPEYDSAIFKITSFRELQQKGEEVYSEPLELQGLVWRLKVYPVSEGVTFIMMMVHYT